MVVRRAVDLLALLCLFHSLSVGGSGKKYVAAQRHSRRRGLPGLRPG